MAALRSVALLSCIIAASALRTQVTPVEKVITLLKALRLKTQGEGKREAASYDTFACFCKDTTLSKSTSIKDGNDNIDQLSADIESKTATKNEKETELTDTKQEKEQKTKDLSASQIRCSKEKAEYMANDADLSKAISSLGGAIDALVNTGGSKPTLLSVRKVVAKNVELANALQIVNDGAHWGELTSFIETSSSVDPDDPQYKYHSQHVIQMLHMLKKDFEGKKADADDEYDKANKACQDDNGALDGEIKQLDGHVTNLKVDISKLKSDIATHREDLVKAEGLMKDDQLYLKDLTKLCELRANEWDQRTQMRAGELEALDKALDLLQNGADSIRAKDEKVNERALLLQTHRESRAQSASEERPVSLLQEKSQVQAEAKTSVAMQALQHKALDLLRKEGGRLGSSALSALAVRAASDPFEKVKQLIQKLVERLIQEATDEATKKGFCDESLAKARQDRTFRWESVLKLNGELSQLEAKKKELEFEIDDLGFAITGLDGDLRKATGIRATDKADNLETIDDANAGLKAVNEAIIVLKTFYADALKAGSFVQLSPVEADNPGAGFDGVYQGQQKSSDGIIGLLEVIKSDFERTSRKTTQAEKDAAAAFVKYDRATKADISGKSMKKTLDEQDLKTTISTIAAKMEEMSDNMDLVDKANGEIEELRPMCIDSGMSYKERVQKREDEIAALQKALCILDPEGVEPSCQQHHMER